MPDGENDGTVVPEVDDLGADGCQVAAELPTPLTISQRLPLQGAISDLATTHSRSFGGEVAATLIAGATSQMAIELDNTKSKLTEVEFKADSLAERLSKSEKSNAVLNEKLMSHSRIRNLTGFGIFVGTILLGAGIQLVAIDQIAYAAAAICIAVLLLILSWQSGSES